MATQVELDLDNVLDFSIEYDGFIVGGDTIIFSEWLPPPELCVSHHSWAGTIATGWLLTNPTAAVNEGYTIVNRVYSAIESVTGTDLFIDGNSLRSVVTDLSSFNDKTCAAIGGFTDPANRGNFDVISATINEIIFLAPGFVNEASPGQTVVSAGRVVDKSLLVIITER